MHLAPTASRIAHKGSMMEPPEPSTTEELTKKVEQIIKSSGRRQNAGAELVAFGDEAMTILCAHAAAEGVRARRLRWAAYVSFLMYASIRMMVPAGESGGLYGKFLILGFGVCYIIGIFLTPLRWKATRLLAGLDDVRLVGPLLDAITTDFRDSDLRESLRQSLTRLLPRLRASHAASLLPRHITAINDEVKHCFISRWESGTKVDVYADRTQSVRASRRRNLSARCSSPASDYRQ